MVDFSSVRMLIHTFDFLFVCYLFTIFVCLRDLRLLLNTRPLCDVGLLELCESLRSCAALRPVSISDKVKVTQSSCGFCQSLNCHWLCVMVVGVGRSDAVFVICLLRLL